MTRTMYDSTNVRGLPVGAELYAGYIDFRYANYGAVIKRFPAAVHVPIATTPLTNAGIVGDVEKGNGSASEWVRWVTRRRTAGVDPTIYCSKSTWDQVAAVFAAKGVHPPHWWIADWVGHKVAPPKGSVAVQWKSYRNYDVSNVADYWPGIDPPLVSSLPHPQPSEEDIMHATLLPTGKLTVAARDIDDHLLVFTSAGPWPASAAERWSVIDVTDGIGTDKAGHTYTIVG